MELVSFGDDLYLKPYIPIIQRRYGKYLAARTRLTGSPRRTSLKAAAAEHKFFGLHRQKDGSWVFREWAPAAARIILAGDFSNFAEQKRFELHRIPDRPGCWEITLPGSILRHGMHYEEKLYFADGTVHRRLPAMRIMWCRIVKRKFLPLRFTIPPALTASAIHRRRDRRLN